MHPAAAVDVRDTRSISEAFLEYDCGAKGHLTRHELRAAHLALLGYLPSLVELDALMPKRPEGRACMELGDFCAAMAQRLRTQDRDEVIRRTFRAFDADLKGFVSFADLQSALQQVAPQLPLHTASLVFAQVDTDGDGRVSYKDFHAMMSALPAPAS